MREYPPLAIPVFDDAMLSIHSLDFGSTGFEASRDGASTTCPLTVEHSYLPVRLPTVACADLNDESFRQAALIAAFMVSGKIINMQGHGGTVAQIVDPGRTTLHRVYPGAHEQRTNDC
jgi:hypothetical protein